MKRRNAPCWKLPVALAGTALLLTTAARADFNPIPLTPESFTHDMVVEKTAPAPLNVHVSATMDGGTNNNAWTFFEQGYLPSLPLFGLPPQGTQFEAPNDPYRVFRLAPNYAANNALLVYTNGSPSGSLNFTAPAAYSALAVLASSGGGEVPFLDYTVYFQGGATQAGTIVVRDWFNTSAPEVAWNANGRINMDNGQVGNLYGTTPKLFYQEIYLNDNVTPVTRIDFASTNGNRAAIFGVSGLTGTGYSPIAVTGFNRDMIIEKTAPVSGTLQNRITVTMDGGANTVTGNTWYEAGFNPAAPTTGLPTAGSSISAGNRTFTMPASYAENNSLYLSDFRDFGAGTLTVTTPAVYTGLSFLGAAGNGPLVVSVTVHHADFGTEIFEISLPDWFNTTDSFFTANGRVNPVDLSFNNVNNNNPRLHAVNVVLASTSPVTQIEFTRVSGGRGPIFAVSGQTTAGGNFNPVGVSGYNADIVVEASPVWPPHGLQTYTTASMDGGVGNTGATWHERGYYPQFPASGLPPAGAIVTSLDKSDHHYQMPATYAGNNAAFVDSVRSNVNLTLASPAPYSALSFLSATANNSVTNQVIVQFQDGTSETNTFVSRDWFNNTPFAYTARGRVNLISRTMNNAHTENPRLYEAEFALANNTSPVTNVNIQFLGAVNPTTGRMAVLAVSAAAGAVRPIIATQPSPVLTIEGSDATLAAVMGGGTEPIAYQWYVGTSGAYVPVQDNTVISGATTPTLTFTSIGWTNAADYYLVAQNVAGPSTSSVVAITVRSGLADVTVPGDTVALIAGTAPANEDAPNAINNNTTKFLNRDMDDFAPFDPPVGFTVKPSVGGTIVNVLRLYTANDAEGRDPASYQLEGSNDDGGSWTMISSGALALPTARNAANLPLDPLTQALQEVRFANSTAYTSYKLSFNSVRDGAQHLMQIGEVEFLGTVAAVSGPPVVQRDLPAKVLVYAGRTLTLSTLVGGTAPITYTWQKGGAAMIDGGTISGATTDTLVIANAQASDDGTYQVIANNALGTASSTMATVTVQVIPDLNGDGTGWTLNGGATVTDGLLTLTSGENGQARSVFYNYPLYIGSFKASFTYQNVNGGGADGFAFVVQNSAVGTAALGGAGGALAYNGITPSAALLFNIYNTGGIALGTNGVRVGDFAPTDPVDIRSTSPIDVELEYSGGQMKVTLTDTLAPNTFTTTLPIDLPGFAGGQTAYVGFTGATGGVNATQTIQNFQYLPVPAVAAGKGGTSEVVVSWPASIGGYVLQSRENLTAGTWANVAAPVTQVNDQNQVTVTATGTQFYRLVLQ